MATELKTSLTAPARVSQYCLLDAPLSHSRSHSRFPMTSAPSVSLVVGVPPVVVSLTGATGKPHRPPIRGLFPISLSFSCAVCFLLLGFAFHMSFVVRLDAESYGFWSMIDDLYLGGASILVAASP